MFEESDLAESHFRRESGSCRFIKVEASRGQFSKGKASAGFATILISIRFYLRDSRSGPSTTIVNAPGSKK